MTNLIERFRQHVEYSVERDKWGLAYVDDLVGFISFQYQFSLTANYLMRRSYVAVIVGARSGLDHADCRRLTRDSALFVAFGD